MHDEPALTEKSSKRLATPSGKRKALIVMLFSSIVVSILSLFAPLHSQQRNLRAAQRHIDVIAPVIRADNRFHDVLLQPYTGRGGCLGVFGSVATSSDFADLKRIVENSKPPVDVYYSVFTDSSFMVTFTHNDAPSHWW